MMQNNAKGKYTFIDLFAGCGGLSEGFYRQGFQALAHVEINPWACETLRERMRYYGFSPQEIQDCVIEKDITDTDILETIEEVTKGQRVDVIIGGPPCQAYSTAGRVRDAKGMEQDPRNYLFESYVRILEHFRPIFFVFENVLGLFSAKVNGEHIFPKIIEALSREYNVESTPQTITLNSVEYGVPQLRKRIILMGVRKDIKEKRAADLYGCIQKTHGGPDCENLPEKKLKRYVSVRDAISDLPPVEPGNNASTYAYDYPCNNQFLRSIGKKGIHPLMDHVARKHNNTDRERFRIMIHNGWSFGELRRKMPQYEHEHARLFDNSYVVQWWDLPSKTIIAHIHKDGFQFIHPDEKQARSFTIREAARIQSFPDDFVFKGPNSEKFKQIGNAVPPLFAEALAKSVKKNLHDI